MWRAFNVGPNMCIPWNGIVICPPKKKDLEEEIPFFLTSYARQFTSVGESKGDGDGNGDSSYHTLSLVAVKILRPRPTLTSI